MAGKNLFAEEDQSGGVNLFAESPPAGRDLLAKEGITRRPSSPEVFNSKNKREYSAPPLTAAESFQKGFQETKSPVEAFGTWLSNTLGIPEQIGAERMKTLSKVWKSTQPEELPIGKADPTMEALGGVSKAALDPTAAVLAPSRAAVPIIAKLSSIGLRSTAYGGLSESLNQLADSGQITSVEDIGKSMALMGVGGPVVDRTLAGARYLGVKTLDNVQAGLNERRALQQTLRENPNVPGFEQSGEKPVSFTTEGPKASAYNSGLVQSMRDTRDAMYDSVNWMSDKVSNVVRSVSERIQDYSPMIAQRLRQFEMDSSVKIHEGVLRVDPFLTQFKSLSKAERNELKYYALNEDKSKLLQFMSTRPELKKAYDQMQDYFKELTTELQKVGYDIPEKEIYFPRVVSDWKGLVKSLSGDQPQLIDRALAEEANRLGISVSQLTDQQKSDLFDKMMRNRVFGGLGTSTSSLRERTIEDIPAESLNFYASLDEGIHQYVRHTNHAIEKRKFFGFGDNIHESIGSVVAKAVEAGDLRNSDINEVRNLLEARFIGGEMSPGKAVKRFKNIFYSTTLGQVSPVLTQFGDIGPSIYVHGLGNTLRGMFGKEWTNVSDFGISMAERDMADSGGTSKYLNRVLKYTGFQALDRFGKNTQLNASFAKWSTRMKTDKGRGQFVKEWGKAMEPAELQRTMDDFAAGRVTYRTKQVLWSELSQTQPISLSELPKFYLDNPNARVLYMLQTFTTKQMSLFYRTALKKIASGDPKAKLEGIKDAAAYAAILGSINMSVDEAKQYFGLKADDNLSPADMEAWTNQIWRVFGMSSYMNDKLTSGNKDDFMVGISGLFLSPISLAYSQTSNAYKTITDPDEINWLKLVKDVPGMGAIYMLFGGGLEESQAKQDAYTEKKANKEFNELYSQ